MALICVCVLGFGLGLLVFGGVGNCTYCIQLLTGIWPSALSFVNIFLGCLKYASVSSSLIEIDIKRQKFGSCFNRPFSVGSNLVFENGGPLECGFFVDYSNIVERMYALLQQAVLLQVVLTPFFI